MWPNCRSVVYLSNVSPATNLWRMEGESSSFYRKVRDVAKHQEEERIFRLINPDQLAKPSDREVAAKETDSPESMRYDDRQEASDESLLGGVVKP